MLHIALEVPLALLGVRRLFQRHHARATRIQVFHHALDGAALARRVAPFKQNHHALPGGLDPGLQLQQFHLQLVLLLFVIAAQHAVAIGVDAFAPVHRQLFVGVAPRGGRLRVGLQQRAMHGARVIRRQFFDDGTQRFVGLRFRAYGIAAGNVRQHRHRFLPRGIFPSLHLGRRLRCCLGYSLGHCWGRCRGCCLLASRHPWLVGLVGGLRRARGRSASGRGATLGCAWRRAAALARRSGNIIRGGLRCLVCHRSCPCCACRLPPPASPGRAARQRQGATLPACSRRGIDENQRL
ncbi:hypothetical protein D3C85_550120 [compost metagenome]